MFLQRGRRALIGVSFSTPQTCPASAGHFFHAKIIRRRRKRADDGDDSVRYAASYLRIIPIRQARFRCGRTCHTRTCGGRCRERRARCRRASSCCRIADKPAGRWLEAGEGQAVGGAWAPRVTGGSATALSATDVRAEPHSAKQQATTTFAANLVKSDHISQ
jgi:hypothetical protein